MSEETTILKAAQRRIARRRMFSTVEVERRWAIFMLFVVACIVVGSTLLR